MTPAEFEFVAKMLKDRSGLILSSDKMYLLESRLTPVARQRGMANLDELVKALHSNPAKDLLEEVTEAMTTNESFFFRDQKPFDQFKAVTLPYMIQNRAAQRKLRIWSAAASTGQEPYSLAMLIKEEAAKMAGWNVDILGTDLSTEVLGRAKDGMYTQFEVQRGLPIQLLIKYFDQQEENWKLKDEIRQMVQYKPFNLLDSMAGLGKFDVVYCRNVLIYFDQETKGVVLNKISDILADDGFLFLGGAETVLGITDKFKPVQGQRGMYCKSSFDFTVPA